MSETNKWIPVSERLPEKDKQVLVCLSGLSLITLGYLDNWASQWDLREKVLGYTLFETHEAVTHWQPLPEPPQL